MKKKIFCFILISVLFFFLGLWIVYSLFDRTKREIILNNNTIVMSIIENHPELEGEIVDSLKEVSLNQDFSILEKYGLTSLSSLEYLDDIENLKNTFFGSFFLLFFLALSIIGIYLFCLERTRKKEIEKIDQYLFSLLSHDIEVDLKDFQSGDLASLQNDLMKVTSRLKNALETSKKDKVELSKTLADISHQLKTPLTSLLILNDNLSSFTIDEKTRQEFLKKQEQIILHMKSLIVTLLKVSQIESGMIELKKEILSINDLVSYALEQVDLLLVAKNITVKKEISKNLKTIGDFNWLCEALLNIIKNACEHSKENGIIEITARDNPMYTEILITDHGEGISKKDLKHIFERFYKSSSDKESIGIGLNLTKSILSRSNATISCKSEVGKYTTFIIHFYKGIV